MLKLLSGMPLAIFFLVNLAAFEQPLTVPAAMCSEARLAEGRSGAAVGAGAVALQPLKAVELRSPPQNMATSTVRNRLRKARNFVF